MLFVVGAASLRPSRCKQNSRIFFCAAPFESFIQFFAKRVYEPNFATFFCDCNFDILLTVLDVFHFCVSCFVGGSPHQKGVCILDVFYLSL